jgi:hypothetical protein
VAVNQRDILAARRRKMHVYSDQIGLTDEERIDFAQVFLRRDITSWSQLDDAQVGRILDALEGFLLVGELIRQRPGWTDR